MPTKEQIIEQLKLVQDPELHIDVWTLEIIYDIQIREPIVYIQMTFTTPFCPYGPALVNEIKAKVNELADVQDTEIDVVFEPPWKPSDELLDLMTMGV